MKTNTMLVPETLTPLADADLQKWCERKCVAQVLRKKMCIRDRLLGVFLGK